MKRRWWLALIWLAAACAYWPVTRAGFIWDDDAHVTRPELQGWEGLARIWTQPGATQQYYPVLHSAFWLEHHLWGDAPRPYHLLNVAWHALDASLLGLLLEFLLSAEAAWIAALLFALHPLAAESVAWVSEQKNTLSTAFYLGAALLYLRWDRDRRLRDYGWASACFVLALLSKSVTATLPVALAVVLAWKGRKPEGEDRHTRRLAPLIPWLAVAVAAGGWTSWLERTQIGAQGPEFTLSFLHRLLLAARIWWFYLAKFLWPHPLVFVYSRWHASETTLFSIFLLAVVAAVYVALAVGAALVRGSPLDSPRPGPTWERGHVAEKGTEQAASPGRGQDRDAIRSKAERRPSGRVHAEPTPSLMAWRVRAVVRGLLVLLLLYGIALGPVLGFVNVYPFIFSYVADHFAYLALLPLCAGTGALLARIPAGRICAAVIALLCLGLTRVQAAKYVSSENLYRVTLAENPAAWLAHLNLGGILADRGDAAGAVEQMKVAETLQPDYPSTHFNLGKIYLAQGRLPDAAGEFNAVLRLSPHDAEAHDNLAVTLAQMGNGAEAEDQFAAAFQARPIYPLAHCNRAIFLWHQGRLAEARAELREALKEQPGMPTAETLLRQLEGGAP